MSLFREVWDGLTFCRRYDISLRVRHIPGRLNVIADSFFTGISDLHRVVDLPADNASSVQPVGNSNSGFIRHQVQQQASTVCVSCSGSQSTSSGCVVNVMGQPVCLRLSTTKADTTGPPTGQRIECENHSNSSSVAEHAMVQRPVGSGGRSPQNHYNYYEFVNSENTCHINPKIFHLHGGCYRAIHQKG